MDNRFNSLFLIIALIMVPTTLWAEEFPEDEEPVVDPQIQRLELKEPEIDDENFELGAYFGYMSVENFGTHEVYGLNAAWHVTEDIFFTANYGTTSVDTTPVEDFNDLNLVSDDDRDFVYYNLSMGWNLFPGEIFLGEDWAFNTQFYVLLGGGAVDFLGDREFALNFGAGLRMIATDYLAVHLGFQDILTDKPAVLNPLGRDGSAHNMQYTAGLTFFF